MKNNIYTLLIICLISLACNSGTQEKKPIFIKEKMSTIKENIVTGDLVPDTETAIKIAEAIWLPLYGNEIYKDKPFLAELKNDSIWIVKGSMSSDKGGVPYIEISKKDCRIITVYHEK